MRLHKIKTKLVGVRFENRQLLLENMPKDERAGVLRMEPDNPHDKNAVQVLWDDNVVGYLNKFLAKDVTSALEDGHEFDVVLQVTGEDKSIWGCNCCLTPKQL